jgi:hypothetical protein
MILGGKMKSKVLIVIAIAVVIIGAGGLMLVWNKPGGEIVGASPSPGVLKVGDYMKASWTMEGVLWESNASVIGLNGSGYDCHLLTTRGGLEYNSFDFYAANWTQFNFGPLGDWITPKSTYEGNRTIDTAFGPRLVNVYSIDSKNNPEIGLVPGQFHWYLGANNLIVYRAEIDYEGSNSEDHVSTLVESNIAWV